jgi:hypothetical protein
MGADVATVAIGGKIVVEDHQSHTIDVDGLYCEVRAFCASRPYVQAWHGTWHETMLETSKLAAIADNRVASLDSVSTPCEPDGGRGRFGDTLESRENIRVQRRSFCRRLPRRSHGTWK